MDTRSLPKGDAKFVVPRSGPATMRNAPNSGRHAKRSHSDVAVAETRVRADVSVITAFVVQAAGCDLDDAALQAFCAEHLASYKQPRRFVFVNYIDQTANGKVDRKGLVRRAG